MSKKILFIDSWTKGIHNFLPIAEKLKEKSVNSLLIHRGSWGAETGRPDEEYIQGLLVRDISYYKTRIVHKILQKEKPDGVLVLTSNTIMDRAVILACRSLGIKIFFLMHGIRPVGDNIEKWAGSVNKQLRSIRWGRAGKYLRFTLPNYFYSGICENAFFMFKMSPYQLIFNTFRNPAIYICTPPPSDEMICDIGLVWANEYLSLFRDLYGYPESNLRVVGHPPLDSVFEMKANLTGEMECEKFYHTIGLNRGDKYTLYLEDSFVEAGLDGWTDQSRREHLQEIADIARSAGRILIIKIHPGTKDDGLKTLMIDNPYVRVVYQTDLAKLILFSETCIAHISSTVCQAVCLDKPVLVPLWGVSSNAPDYYIKEGAAFGCRTPEDMKALLEKGKKISDSLNEKRNQYIDKFISKTDGLAVERIVGELISV